MVEFRKRRTDGILADINEMMIQFNLSENSEDDDSENNSHTGGGEDAESDYSAPITTPIRFKKNINSLQLQ